MFTENQSKQIEYLIAWSTIAYLAGFVTVMAHTARLGIPIIEILKPVYIWIGLPLALVIFSIRLLWRLIVNRVNETKTEFQTIKNEIAQTISTRNIQDKDITELVDIYIEYFSGLLAVLPFNFLNKKLLNMMQNRLRKIAEQAIQKSLKNVDEEKKGRLMSAQYSGIKLALLTEQGLNETTSVLSFLVMIFLIPVFCYFYIFEIYPLVPQSLGGGKPTSVMLILNTENLPMQSTEMLALFPSTTIPKDSKSAITTKVEILYTTSDQYYIRCPNSKIISFNKELIDGIVWNP